MITTRIHCDHCAADITRSHGYQEYRFKLEVEPMPTTGSTSVDVHCEPPIEDIHHFCGWGCIGAWIHKRIK